MVKLFNYFVVSTFMILSSTTLLSQKLGFDRFLSEHPFEQTTFCVANSEENILLLKNEGVHIKYASGNWLFITTTPTWISEKTKSKELSDFYFEFAPPSLMSDTARVHHYVDQVHAGSDGLQLPFTGKDVVIGYVDTGIDYTHPDFKDENGDTRILYYWDQSLFTGPIPPEYGYGTLWDSTAINNGTCTSVDNSGHGSTVTGQGSGNGLANGTNKGMAPDSKIVVVESNFNAGNWTLTVTDACDFIFKVADSLGLPAVINLSIGTYLGSHDGNDPASEMIESFLDEKEGRIVICAAGNSGNQGNYHQHNDVDSDTSFVWFKNNPTGAFGANTIFFDLWTDVTDATFDFGFGADEPSPTYTFIDQTEFHDPIANIGTVIYDTIWKGSDQVATIEVYRTLIGPTLNMQVLFTQVDSTDYLYRFMTTGSGQYDLWSGAWLGLNDMEQTLPSAAVKPEIVHYVLPDAEQSIVSSWNCSEKVISVGNFRNRLGHIDGNYNQYYPAGDLTPPGQLSVNSSKGPSRKNIIKPDVSAAGDVSVGAAPSWAITNPGWYPSLDSGKMHLRNGGTSMSSPVVAGIAALYLEKCSKANYVTFKNDLLSTSYSDQFTGVTPNNSYGHGKPHALDLLLSTNFNVDVLGVAGMCEDPIDLFLNSESPADSIQWSNGSDQILITIDTPDEYSAIVYDDNGCIALSDTHQVVQFPIPTIDEITQSGLTLSTNASGDYQWTLDGVDIIGENQNSHEASAPFGTYTCYTTNSDGCVAETSPITLTVGLSESASFDLTVFPNPFSDVITINTELQLLDVYLVGANGAIVPVEKINQSTYSTKGIDAGIYYLKIITPEGANTVKLSKL